MKIIIKAIKALAIHMHGYTHTKFGFTFQRGADGEPKQVKIIQKEEGICTLVRYIYYLNSLIISKSGC